MSSTRSRLAHGLLAVSLLLAACASAPGGEVPTDDAGAGDGSDQIVADATVRLISSESCGGAECHTVGVTCRGLPERQVRLRHFPRASSQATVVLTSGAYGTQPYDQLPVKRDTREFLTDNGFEVFQVEWLGQQGWVEGAEGAGFEDIMCGYAAIVEWIAAEKAANPELMCAQGNSGGALQIAYGLSLYGLGETLDMVVLSAGPPVSRVDTYCVPPNADKLREQMAGRSGGRDPSARRGRRGRRGRSQAGRSRSRGAPNENFGRSTSRGLIDEVMGWENQGDYCSLLEPLPDDQLLFSQRTSLVSPLPEVARQFAFPHTKVNFVGSERDHHYQKQGSIYFDAVESDKAWYDIPGKAHKIDNQEEGAQLVRKLFLSECRAW